MQVALPLGKAFFDRIAPPIIQTCSILLASPSSSPPPPKKKKLLAGFFLLASKQPCMYRFGQEREGSGEAGGTGDGAERQRYRSTCVCVCLCEATAGQTFAFSTTTQSATTTPSLVSLLRADPTPLHHQVERLEHFTAAAAVEPTRRRCRTSDRITEICG